MHFTRSGTMMATIATAVVLVVAGCGGGQKANSTSIVSSAAPSASTTFSPPAPAILPFPSYNAVVDLDSFGGNCAVERCWLPTQFTPKLVAGQTVSLYDQWPKSGDAVQIVCTTSGSSYYDENGNTVTHWYGIYVPPVATQPNLGQVARVAADGHLGYVGISWLADVHVVGHVPDCKDFKG